MNEQYEKSYQKVNLKLYLIEISFIQEVIRVRTFHGGNQS